MAKVVNDSFKVRSLDIYKLIDDAMEKKDRTINIFISGVGTSVYINPSTDDKPMWIHKELELNWDTADTNRNRYICSECGKTFEVAFPYCPICGEKMCGIKERENNHDQA